jgi:hypothetical protein
MFHQIQFNFHLLMLVPASTGITTDPPGTTNRPVAKELNYFPPKASLHSSFFQGIQMCPKSEPNLGKSSQCWEHSKTHIQYHVAHNIKSEFSTDLTFFAYVVSLVNFLWNNIDLISVSTMAISNATRSCPWLPLQPLRSHPHTTPSWTYSTNLTATLCLCAPRSSRAFNVDCYH